MTVSSNVVSSFAIEIDLNNNTTDSEYGISGGLFRYITTDMLYDVSSVLLGDSCDFSSNGNATETFDVSCKTGDLYEAENGEFKSADTEPININFLLTNTTDFSGGELAAAKGAAIAIGDVFLCSEDDSGDYTPIYKGSNIWERNRLVQLSDTSMKIDIAKYGNYGTVSGFSVDIRNDNDLLKWLVDNSLELRGKKVKEYYIISNTSYQLYVGTIQDVKKYDNKFTLIITSEAQSKHTELPPRTVTQKEYSKLGVKNTTKTIPVTLGDVPHAQSVNVSEVQTFDYLYRIDKFYSSSQIDLLQMQEGDEWLDSVAKAEIVLIGNYINLVSDYNDSLKLEPNLERLYRVESVDSVTGSVADGYLIKVTLERAFEEDTPTELESKICSNPDDLGKSWFVRLIDMNNVRLTSNEEIAGYSRVSLL